MRATHGEVLHEHHESSHEEPREEEMRRVIFVGLVVCAVIQANRPGTIDLQRARSNLYLQTPETIEQWFGHPFEKKVFENEGRHDWIKRMIWFYYSPDSSEVVALMFDYVSSKKGLRKSLKKKVLAGNYHLITVVYKPEYLHEHAVRFTDR